MYRLELSDIEKIEEYRKCLDLEPLGMDKAIKISLVDELLKKIDEGTNEPIEVAYMLFMKYSDWYIKSGYDLFRVMADEAAYIVDLCDSYFECF